MLIVLFSMLSHMRVYQFTAQMPKFNSHIAVFNVNVHEPGSIFYLTVELEI